MVKIRHIKKESVKESEFQLLSESGHWIAAAQKSWKNIVVEYVEEVIDEGYNDCGIRIFVDSYDSVIIYREVRKQD